MDQRIRNLRKALDLTQQSFADRLGIKQNTIAKYETGRGTPTRAIVSLICREFHVSEEWLRTGNGDMFIPEPESLVDELVQEYGLDDLDRRILQGYLRLPESDRAAIKRYVRSLLDAPDKLPAEPVDHQAVWEAEARAEAEEVYREILAEKRAAAGLSASPDGTGGAKGA